MIRVGHVQFMRSGLRHVGFYDCIAFG